MSENYFHYLELISTQCLEKLQRITDEQTQVEQRTKDVFVVLNDAIQKLSQMQELTDVGVAVGVHFYLKALDSI